MNDSIKKLTGKNKSDYEQVAYHLINTSDVSLFEELVKQDDFLFDFVKQNVAQRLQNACNSKNYKNLLSFLKVYSPFYEDFIVSTLAKFADEDLTDELLEKFENGSENEKIYCAKYFAHIQDPLALPLLNKFAFSENENLASNSAQTLGAFQDKESYDLAIEKLNSDDDFEQFSGINFLVAYGDKNAVTPIIETMKKSSMAENIAGEIPYLVDLKTLLQENLKDGLLVLNNIVNGLAEILPLVAVFDYNLYEVFSNLIEKADKNSMVTTVLANAKEKFDTLTENDEYLFDEDKNTKNEVLEIKSLLQSVKILSNLIDNEIREESPFIFTALDLTTNSNIIKPLLECQNPTLVLKSVEVLKKLGELDKNSRELASLNVKDENIKLIIQSL